MKNRAIRLALCAGIVAAAAAPAAPAQAWTCLGEVGYAMCLAVNTACTPVNAVRPNTCVFG